MSGVHLNFRECLATTPCNQEIQKLMTMMIFCLWSLKFGKWFALQSILAEKCWISFVKMCVLSRKERANYRWLCNLISYTLIIVPPYLAVCFERKLLQICYLVSYGSLCHYGNFSDDTSYEEVNKYYHGWWIIEFIHWPKLYLLLSATCDEILWWMIEIWIKNYLLLIIITTQKLLWQTIYKGNYKEWQIMWG